MSGEPAKCEACGRELDGGEIVNQGIPVNPSGNAPRNWAESNLQQHIQLLDKLTAQVDELLESVRGGNADSERVLEKLETLRQHLKPRHGLCIDPNCGPCRVHEEAIKEHVLLYVDWKVPGTVQKLEQARRRN